MNLYSDLASATLHNLAHQQMHFAPVAESRCHVMPHDPDLFGPVNSGRYLQNRRVAGVERVKETILAGAIKRRRRTPALGGDFIRIRSFLRLFQRLFKRYSERTRPSNRQREVFSV